MTERRRVPCQPSDMNRWLGGHLLGNVWLRCALCLSCSAAAAAWIAWKAFAQRERLWELLLPWERSSSLAPFRLLSGETRCCIKTASIPPPHIFIFFKWQRFGGWWWLLFFFFSFSGFWNRFAGGYLFIYLHNSLYMLRMCTFSSWNSICLLLLDMPSWPELNPFLSAKFSPFKVIPHVKMV